MRKLCPNFEREDSLETVLDVPIPEDMFSGLGNNAAVRWQNMAMWMKAQPMDKWSSQIVASKYNEMSFLLYIVGSPLLPFHLQLLPDRPNINRPTKNSSIEASTAKYIVQQYIAATGGLPALNAVHSMCVIGHVKISASEFHQGDENVKSKNLNEEAGGFVLWQKNPDQWCLELIINGSKVISGCNGNISWRQSSNQQRPISKGPPRPLRRFLKQQHFTISIRPLSSSSPMTSPPPPPPLPLCPLLVSNLHRRSALFLFRTVAHPPPLPPHPLSFRNYRHRPTSITANAPASNHPPTTLHSNRTPISIEAPDRALDSFSESSKRWRSLRFAHRHLFTLPTLS
ncbi:hypothetical protein ACS0TY_030173 [Phlomoides rotata]